MTTTGEPLFMRLSTTATAVCKRAARGPGNCQSQAAAKILETGYSITWLL